MRPKIADVVEAPHDLYEGDKKVFANLPADRVRTNVRNANDQGLDMEQDSDGTIRILTRRYVPQKPKTSAEMPDTPEQREAERLQQRADALTKKAERMSEHASGMYGRFAGGQPLLRGHHSYRSAVRDRSRADNATRRAIAAGEEAKQAQQKAGQAKAVAALAAVEATQSCPWQRSDFQPGDIVTVRDFRRDMALTSTYRVKRVNTKTLTLDGGGGGWDDPKRTYDRILSRTRDGVTITDPADA